MSSFIYSLRLILAAIIAFSLMSYLQWQESYWIIISALLSLQLGEGYTWQKKIMLLVITGLLASSFAWILGLATGLPPSYNWERFLSILSGFGIALILQTLFFPTRQINLINNELLNCINALIQLNQSHFAALIKRNYTTNIFSYEKLWHENRRAALHAFFKFRSLDGAKRIRGSRPLLQSLEHTYDILQSLNHLTPRITDSTTFEVAQPEFQALLTAINTQLEALETHIKTPNTPLPHNTLPEKITQLEDVYRSALQVVVREPSMFLYFINDLKDLNRLLEQMLNTE